MNWSGLFLHRTVKTIIIEDLTLQTDMLLLPLFPLEIVVFPREQLNLHIFEERYRQLILDCLGNPDLIFGIPFYRQGFAMQYGTLLKLDEVSEYHPNGSMDIKTIGLRPFELKRLVKTMPDKLYPGGYVIETYWEDEADLELRVKILARILDLYELMNITQVPDEFYTSFISFDVAHKVGLSKEQEYHLLKITAEPERQQYIIDHLDNMIPLVKEAEKMKRKVQLNGHFKHLLPPTL